MQNYAICIFKLWHWISGDVEGVKYIVILVIFDICDYIFHVDIAKAWRDNATRSYYALHLEQV